MSSSLFFLLFLSGAALFTPLPLPPPSSSSPLAYPHVTRSYLTTLRLNPQAPTLFHKATTPFSKLRFETTSSHLSPPGRNHLPLPACSSSHPHLPIKPAARCLPPASSLLTDPPSPLCDSTPLSRILRCMFQKARLPGNDLPIPAGEWGYVQMGCSTWYSTSWVISSTALLFFFLSLFCFFRNASFLLPVRDWPWTLLPDRTSGAGTTYHN